MAKVRVRVKTNHSKPKKNGSEICFSGGFTTINFNVDEEMKKT